LDKSQVIALGLICRRFAKKSPNGSIRKFQLRPFRPIGEPHHAEIHSFETITSARWKLAIHHLHRMQRVMRAKAFANPGRFAAPWRALGFI
jgi:hypothetical protein